MAPRSRPAASETPQRVTRARSKTPLPSIDQTTSQAYGAPGKANLNQQLRQAGDFSQHFEVTRASSQAAAPPQHPAGSRTGTVEPPPVSAPSQAANLRRRQYGAKPAAIQEEEVSEVGSRRAPSPGRNATVLDHDAAYNGVVANISAGIQRQMANPNSLTWLLVLSIIMIGFGFVLGVFSLFVPLPPALAPAQGSIISGMRATFQQPRDPLLLDLERRTATVEGLTLGQRKVLEEMKQHVVLETVNGQAQISPEFWSVLQRRLSENSELSPAFKEDILMYLRQQSGLVEEMAERTVRRAFQKVPEIPALHEKLSKLSHFGLLDNWWRNMHAVNWFSVGMGARVDPHLTSATKTQGPEGWLYALYSSINPLYVAPNPPIAALLKWDEATECWCGAPDENGHVQISIITHTKFYPDHMVLEHIPKDGTTQIDAAPREVEVWIDLGSETLAERYREYYTTDANYIEAGGCGTAPGKTWLCVKKGEYDIHNVNHVQLFPLWIWTHSERLQVNKMIIRANTNWGAPHTCFYRIKMLGDAIDPEVEAGQKPRKISKEWR